jgi:hypothetical protein
MIRLFVELESIVPLIDAVKHTYEPDLPFEVVVQDKKFKAIVENLLTCVIRRDIPKTLTIQELFENEDIVWLIEQLIACQISKLIIREKLRRITLQDLEGSVILHL